MKTVAQAYDAIADNYDGDVEARTWRTQRCTGTFLKSWPPGDTR